MLVQAQEQRVQRVRRMQRVEQQMRRRVQELQLWLPSLEAGRYSMLGAVMQYAVTVSSETIDNRQIESVPEGASGSWRAIRSTASRRGRSTHVVAHQ